MQRGCERPSHHFSRALKVQCNGSPIHKQSSWSSFSDFHRPLTSSGYNSERPVSVDERCFTNINRSTLNKSLTKSEKSNYLTVSDNGNTSLLTDVQGFSNCNVVKNRQRFQLKNERDQQKVSIARCRSAPAHSVLALSKYERGFTSTALSGCDINKNKIVQPPKKPALQHTSVNTSDTPPRPMTPQERWVSAAKMGKEFCPDIGFSDLKIKTFELQLEYEKELKKSATVDSL